MGWREKLLESVARAAEEYNKASEKIDTTKEVVKGAAKIAADLTAQKTQEVKEANAKKPSTGSSILDAFLPAVPHTEGTKPKTEKAAEKAKKSAPPQP
jgi:protein subunit release factor A